MLLGVWDLRLHVCRSSFRALGLKVQGFGRAYRFENALEFLILGFGLLGGFFCLFFGVMV